MGNVATPFGMDGTEGWKSLDEMRADFPTFEQNGAYSDPGWSGGLTISNPLPEKMDIDGVTDNPILFPPFQP